MYKNYENIEAGFTGQAIRDLTGIKNIFLTIFLKELLMNGNLVDRMTILRKSGIILSKMIEKNLF